MKELANRVAVVTGAASGIGLAMARAFAREGMRLVMADVEDKALYSEADRLREDGAEVLAVRANVAKASEVEELARRSEERFGNVHVLCNNAGVGASGALIECTLDDWEWVLGVNLWGVVHGIRSFLPRMLAHGEEGRVVNTASFAGLVTGPGLGVYGVTKHAVVCLSETLFHELRLMGSRIGVSVVCPGWVHTNIADSDRNRPEDLASTVTEKSPQSVMFEEFVRGAVAGGITPESVASHVVEAIKSDRFYVITHPEWLYRVKSRMECILEQRDPEFIPPEGLTAPHSAR